MVRAKGILEQNQYPSEFYDGIIKPTIDKIILKEKEEEAARNLNSDENQLPNFIFVTQYGGNVTDNFIKQLKKSGALVCNSKKSRSSANSRSLMHQGSKT